jgi:hypothetical protein
MQQSSLFVRANVCTAGSPPQATGGYRRKEALQLVADPSAQTRPSHPNVRTATLGSDIPIQAVVVVRHRDLTAQ